MSENTNTSEKSDHKDNPLHWLPKPGQTVAIPGGLLWCEQWDVDRFESGHISGEIRFRFRVVAESYEGIMTQRKAFTRDEVILLGDDSKHSDNETQEAAPCPHCGSLKGQWFSRSLPMSYHCEDCGKDVDQIPEKAEEKNPLHNEPQCDCQERLVRLYVEGEDLAGRLMCYRCRHSFPAPKGVLMAQDVKCPNCKAVDAYYQHKCHESDPNRHSAGWPYDDPTVEYDC